MSWPAPEPTRLSAVARGIRAQWRMQYRCAAAPGLLDVLASDDAWLVTFLHARAHAAGSPRALAIFEAFERELAKVVGHAPVAWPKPFDLCPTLYTVGQLPQLSPEQVMVATAGLRRVDAPTRSLIALLLDRAFGGDIARGQLRGESRVALLAGALVGEHAQTWASSGTFAADGTISINAGAKRLVRDAFGADGASDTVHPVFTVDMMVEPAEAVDLLCSAFTLRACQRAAGDLPISSPDWATAPAANDGIGYELRSRRRVSA